MKPDELAELIDFLNIHDPLMTVTEVAAYLNVSKQHLWSWRTHGVGPAYVSLPLNKYLRVRYRMSAVRMFAAVYENQTGRLPARGRGNVPAALRVTRYATGHAAVPGVAAEISPRTAR